MHRHIDKCRMYVRLESVTDIPYLCQGRAKMAIVWVFWRKLTVLSDRTASSIYLLMLWWLYSIALNSRDTWPSIIPIKMQKNKMKMPSSTYESARLKYTGAPLRTQQISLVDIGSQNTAPGQSTLNHGTSICYNTYSPIDLGRRCFFFLMKHCNEIW